MSGKWDQGAAGGLADLLGAITGGGTADGLGGLLGKLQQAGLREEVDSWVSTGANKPVTPERLGQALGGDELAGLAQRFGAGGGGAMASILAQLLPVVINGLTPQGRLPQNDREMGGGLGDILGQVLGGGRPQSGGGLADILGPLMGAMAGGQQAPSTDMGGLGGLLGSLLGGGGNTAMAPGKGQKTLPADDELPSKSAALGGFGKGHAPGNWAEDDTDPRNPLGNPGDLFRRR